MKQTYVAIIAMFNRSIVSGDSYCVATCTDRHLAMRHSKFKQPRINLKESNTNDFYIACCQFTLGMKVSPRNVQTSTKVRNVHSMAYKLLSSTRKTRTEATKRKTHEQ